MATDINKRESFIKLRVEGLSYEKISKEIGVSKPTLIKWGREEEEVIRKTTKNMQDEFFNEVRRQSNERKEKLIKIMNAAYKSLGEINYEAISERDLLNLIFRLEAKLKEYVDMQIGVEPELFIINIIKDTYKGENKGQVDT